MPSETISSANYEVSGLVDQDIEQSSKTMIMTQSRYAVSSQRKAFLACLNGTSLSDLPILVASNVTHVHFSCHQSSNRVVVTWWVAVRSSGKTMAELSSRKQAPVACLTSCVDSVMKGYFLYNDLLSHCGLRYK